MNNGNASIQKQIISQIKNPILLVAIFFGSILSYIGIYGTETTAKLIIPLLIVYVVGLIAAIYLQKNVPIDPTKENIFKGFINLELIKKNEKSKDFTDLEPNQCKAWVIDFENPNKSEKKLIITNEGVGAGWRFKISDVKPDNSVELELVDKKGTKWGVYPIPAYEATVGEVYKKK
jgi:hypothetical protein